MTAKSTRTLLQIHLALFLLLALLTLPNSAQEDANRTMITSPNDAIIYSHLSRNYNASSATLEMMTRKWEEEMKIQREKMRRDWKRTFDEIREGRIGRNTANVDDVLSDEDEVSQNEDGRAGGQEEVQIAGSRLLDRWKLFLDSKSPKTLRFDGFTSWDKQLQQWSEDVSAYISENVTWTELLKAKEGGGYDLGKFGVTSKGLKELSKLYGESVVDGDDTGSAVSATKTKRFGLDSTSNAPIGTLPIALTALEPNLPDLPKPHPVLPGEAIVPHTDISDLSKNIWIVTTASLPWMTGTAVNPLLRAAYLTRGRKDKGGSVTLLLPWVERPSDQKRIYGKAERFANPDDQEEYIRNWLHDEADMKYASVDLNIKWYTAWQEVAENSLYSMGDLIALIPEEQCDICVLEEPEHLNWYRAPGENWTSKFKHVVGIVHTNYFVYAQEQPAAFIRAPGMRLLCSWMCRAHCHRLIKLSGTLGNFAPEKELVENVHGVRRTFLDIGGELRNRLTTSEAASDPVFSADASPKVYFIGKMLWSKGLGSLMELMKYAEESAGLKVTVDMYGGGPNKDEASEKASGMGLDMPFHGPIDHSELGFSHKIFVNPSLSEVLCTTVAEALAMGKFVVLPNHPSNDFFAQFPNCLPYSNKEEFVGNLYYALTHSPEPLTEEYSHALSWEAATERFAAAGSVSVAEAEAMEEAIKSADAGIDIVLPPLTTSEEQRKKLSMTFRKTRGRYRNFRKRLSQDISKSNVLPKELQQRLITELDKRLDVDLDELLSSPKLRVKLSPAKLDKLLLELYDSVTDGPSGDVFRVIGGGANVGKQNLYLKQQQSKLEKMAHGDVDFSDDPNLVTPVTLVKRALNRNFRSIDQNEDDTLASTKVKSPIGSKETPKMSLTRQTSCIGLTIRPLHRGSFASYRPSMPRYSPLI